MIKLKKQIPELQEIINKIDRWHELALKINPNNEQFILTKSQISKEEYLEYYQSLYPLTLFFNDYDFKKYSGYDLSHKLWIKDTKYKYHQEINDFINNHLYEMSKKQLIEEFTIYYNKIFNIKKNRFPLMLITVRPTTETRFSQFKKLVEKAFSKKWLTRYIYVYEQKGNEKEKTGDGFHIHALIDIPDNKPNSDIYREFRNTFKKVCGPQGVHFYPCVESLRADKLEYMGCTTDYTFIDPNTYDFKKKKGKKDIEKCKCLPFDEQFKLDNNLELCYTN